MALEKPSGEDERVPTFIVVDEAHNLIPKMPRSKLEAALREQFRTVVAEGRKYGLFLIVVSQRPDKLDSLILSECENRAVMRLRSVSVLELTKRTLGLDDLSQRLLEKCLDFETGRALLTGLWAPDATLIYGAARRTVEGGRNLRVEHWGRPG
jgi:DNA helicase HerA-like ATPase